MSNRFVPTSVDTPNADITTSVTSFCRLDKLDRVIADKSESLVSAKMIEVATVVNVLIGTLFTLT